MSIKKEELINKIALWIYNESTMPISEIEYLIKKADAVDDYVEAVMEDQQ